MLPESSLWMFVCWMSMAFVACSSAVDRALWTGEKTSRTPFVRLGSNIMLRLRTLTFSHPGYKLEMLTDTKQREKRKKHMEMLIDIYSRIRPSEPGDFSFLFLK